MATIGNSLKIDYLVPKDKNNNMSCLHGVVLCIKLLQNSLNTCEYCISLTVHVFKIQDLKYQKNCNRYFQIRTASRFVTNREIYTESLL